MTTLYIQQYGARFEVRLRTDVALNAWQGRLILPPELVVQSVTYGGSIGDVWQAPPSLRPGGIEFAGGATAGFSGDGFLFQFTALPELLASPQLVRFDPARTMLYAADGQGTQAQATLRSLTVNSKELAAASSSLTVSAAANLPPEPFALTIVRDPGIFEGRPAIIFAATDLDSGIDRYEVKEITKHGDIDWHIAQSPYLVNPGTTIIMVRAVDRDGLSRTESIAIPAPWPSGGEAALLLGVLLVLGAMAAYLTQRWRRNRSL